MNRRRFIFAVAVLLVAVSLLAVRQYRRREKPLERGQCTWYAFERAREGGWQIAFDKPYGRHARAWWEKVTNGERGDAPRVGAVMVLDEWPGNPYGHVGYVESVESPSKWVVTHANYAVGQDDRVLEGVPIRRMKCERTSDGVKLEGQEQALRLRGFIYPPGTTAGTDNALRLRAVAEL